jgi:hypothetical protein
MSATPADDDGGAGWPTEILRPIPRRAFERPARLFLAGTDVTRQQADDQEHGRGEGRDAVGDSSDDNDDGNDSEDDSLPDAAKQPPSRTRSLLNLTSSTLFGIYSPTSTVASQGDRDEPPTPPLAAAAVAAGTPGAVVGKPANGSTAQPALARVPPPPLSSSLSSHTQQNHPRRRYSHHQQNTHRPQHHYGHHHQRNHHHRYIGLVASAAARAALLFVFGAAYGGIVTHLHDNRALAPVEVVAGVHSFAWPYLIFWGMAGVALGSLLPWIDVLWEQRFGYALAAGGSGDSGGGGGGDGDSRTRVTRGNWATNNNGIRIGNGSTKEEEDGAEEGDDVAGSGGDGGSGWSSPLSAVSTSPMGSDWNSVVRSVGAFVGIAFAIVSEDPPLFPPLLPHYPLFPSPTYSHQIGTFFFSKLHVHVSLLLPWKRDVPSCLPFSLHLFFSGLARNAKCLFLDAISFGPTLLSLSSVTPFPCHFTNTPGFPRSVNCLGSRRCK